MVLAHLIELVTEWRDAREAFFRASNTDGSLTVDHYDRLAKAEHALMAYARKEIRIEPGGDGV